MRNPGRQERTKATRPRPAQQAPRTEAGATFDQEAEVRIHLRTAAGEVEGEARLLAEKGNHLLHDRQRHDLRPAL